MAKMNHYGNSSDKHHICLAKFNQKGTHWSVPVSNAIMDKDTMTKTPSTACMTIPKTASTFAGMAMKSIKPNAI